MKPQVGLSQEQVNKLKGETGINQGLLAQYKPVAPITPSSLNSNETPAQVTAPTVPTQATSLQGSIQAGTDQFTKNQERKYEEALTNKQSSLQDYVGSLLEPGEIARTVDKYGQKGGVDTLEVELNDINDQIRQEQTALARQTEAIQKEAGLTKGQIDQQVAEVGRVSTRKQADLYIIQQGIQGRYDSAKAIADRAVQAEMEVVKQKQDILKTLYEDNKDLFTTAEQRLYDTKLADRNRLIDAEEAQMKEISDLSISALENGASTATVTAMRNAKSVTEALSIGGGYIGLLQRQAANRASANADLARRKDLLELAAMGDQQAISELGYDPNNMPLTAEEIVKNETGYLKNKEDKERVDTLLNSTRGLEATSGTVRTPWLSGLFSGGKAEGVGTLTRFTPVIGNVQGAVQSMSDANDFLADASYVINNLTLDNFLRLKEQGATFGAMQQSEWTIVGSSANELASMAIKDEAGVLVGFRGSEAKVKAELAEIQAQYQIALDRANADLGLTKTERNEAALIYNQ